MKNILTIVYRVFSVVFLGIAIMLNSCKKDDQKPKPSISSFDPISGFEGTQVTITGTNFSLTPSDNVVEFNGTAATVAAATKTSLTVAVPAGSTSGKITVAISGITATSDNDFIVLPPQTISWFSPTSGQAGATVTITGTNFSTTPGDNIVKFNGIDATVTASTGTSLTVAVPDGASTGKITVTISGNTVSSVTDFQLIIDIPRNGLVVFYPFSGDPNDASGNNANGTLQIQNGSGGQAPHLATDRFGTVNHCYNFDGIGSYITVGNPTPLQITGPITVAGWFNSNNNTATGVGGLYQQISMVSKVYFNPLAGGNPQGGFWMQHRGAGVNFYPSYGGSNDIVSYDPVLDLNTWVFVAMVIDGTSYTLYKNGQVVSHINGTAATDSRGDLTIGSYGGGFLFSGMIDDITIYNRALPAAEITQLYQQNITK